MALSLRYYLFPTDRDPRRLSQRLVSGLTAGTDSMPDYAGTRQKVVEVVLENDDGKPERIVASYGMYWSFDDQGGIGESLRESLAAAIDSAFPPSTTGKVVDLTGHLKKKRAEEKHRWKVSKQDLDRIAADIWPSNGDRRLKSAKGTSPKPPPVTFDARHALKESSESFWRIPVIIEDLTEPGLRGFAFEARRMAGEQLEFAPLYRGLAEMADTKLEIVRRRRSGKGTWYAVVEVIQWSQGNTGKTIATFHRRCEGKKAAVVAGRELLAKHASKLSDDITVDARVETDIEWDAAARFSVPDI